MLDTLPHLTRALALATLLAAAAAHKLRAREQWPAVLRQYRLLPEVLVAPVAALLPLTEALAAAALLWPVAGVSLALGSYRSRHPRKNSASASRSIPAPRPRLSAIRALRPLI